VHWRGNLCRPSLICTGIKLRLCLLCEKYIDKIDMQRRTFDAVVEGFCTFIALRRGMTCSRCIAIENCDPEMAIAERLLAEYLDNLPEGFRPSRLPSVLLSWYNRGRMT
jgi:hypothetical protein